MYRLAASVLIVTALVASGSGACDQAEPAGPEITVSDQPAGDPAATIIHTGTPFLGSWKLTSAVLGDEELLAGTGLLYIMTFRSNGKHTVTVSGDMEHLVCPEPQTSCTWNGRYSYTGTTITTVEPGHPDPGEAGEDTALYAYCSGRLIFMDSGDDVGLRLTYKRTGLR
jgi:hypothetical protein